jgi:ribosome-binding factor A
VYVSVLGDAAQRAASLEGLRSAHGFLQGRLAELRLKHTPALTFEYDEALERGMRVSELIDRETRAHRETESPRATGADRETGAA